MTTLLAHEPRFTPPAATKDRPFHFAHILPWLLVVVSTGCGPSVPFLKIPELASYVRVPPVRDSVVLYRKSLDVNSDGEIRSMTHVVRVIGSVAHDRPSGISTLDGPVKPLRAVGGRIIRGSKILEEYGRDDMYGMDLKSRAGITSNVGLFGSYSSPLLPGDIIEEIKVHTAAIPELGEEFSPADAGRSVGTAELIISHPQSVKVLSVIRNGDPDTTTSISEGVITSVFRWTNFDQPPREDSFARNNDFPSIFIAFPPSGKDTVTWTSFGDWYLQLISGKLKNIGSVETLARKLTDGLTDPATKMDSLFQYCQREFRYEIVYLPWGEFIPNDIPTIIAAKYADCKDYSLLLYGLAHSIGLEPHLALCYRGRGYEFEDRLAVSQFNHMIAYAEFDGKIRWYDGTNRIARPGVTSFDLANANALVLERGNSRMVEIGELPDNRLIINGELRVKGRGLSGAMSVTFKGQFAIDVALMEINSNSVDMTQYLISWFHSNISRSAILGGIRWSKNDSTFTMTTRVDLPNTASAVEDRVYISPARVFPELTPRMPEDSDTTRVFYYPSYNRVSVDVTLNDLEDVGAVASIAFPIDLSAGPFTDQGRANFLREFRQLRERLDSTRSYQRTTRP